MDIEQYNENCETIGKACIGGNNASNPSCGKLTTQSVPLSDGIDIDPQGIQGPLVTQVPVVLGEKDIQIDVESKLELEEPYYQIRGIDRDVYLTDYQLIPNIGITQNGIPTTGKLFLSGYVTENIEYSSITCPGSNVINGSINHTQEEIPFNCVTEIEFVNQPMIFKNLPQEEVHLYCSNQCNSHCENEPIGRSKCRNYYEDTIRYTNKPYCELVSARIYDVGTQQDPESYTTTTNNNSNSPTVYNTLSEKMVLFLRLKVLQVQSVSIDC